MAGEPENVMVTALGLCRAGDGLGVGPGQPVAAGLGFTGVSQVDDQLSGVAVILHIVIVSV